jgi:hypothetical protein
VRRRSPRLDLGTEAGQTSKHREDILEVVALDVVTASARVERLELRRGEVDRRDREDLEVGRDGMRFRGGNGLRVPSVRWSERGVGGPHDIDSDAGDDQPAQRRPLVGARLEPEGAEALDEGVVRAEGRARGHDADQRRDLGDGVHEDSLVLSSSSGRLVA